MPPNGHLSHRVCPFSSGDLTAPGRLYCELAALEAVDALSWRSPELLAIGCPDVSLISHPCWPAVECRAFFESTAPAVISPVTTRARMQAVQQYVEVSPEQNVSFTINTHPELGTVCSVDVPVRRVRTQAMSAVERQAALERGEINDDEDDNVPEWREDDMNSDPSSRFPMGC